MTLTLKVEVLSAKARVKLSALRGSVSQNFSGQTPSPSSPWWWLLLVRVLGDLRSLSQDWWGSPGKALHLHNCITDIWMLEGADKLGFTRHWVSLSQLLDLVSSSEFSKILRVPSLENWYSLTTDLQLRVKAQGSSNTSIKERVLALASSRH